MTTTHTTRALVALSLGTLIGASACKKDDAKAATTGTETMMIGAENLAVVKAEELRMGPAISGSLIPEQQATVRAEVSGAVLQTFVDQGQSVSKGTVLARLDDTAIREQSLSAHAMVLTAANSAQVATRELERATALEKAGAIAERALEQARNAQSAANAQLANAKAMEANADKMLEKTRIVAPFSGVVSAKTINAGDLASPGGAMFTVVSPGTMRVEASLPAAQLSQARVGLPVEFHVSGYPNRVFMGRVARVNPVADPVTGQVRIIVSIPNSGNTLVGGLFADGRVASESRTAPVVPASSVDERGLRPAVMRLKGGKVERAEVEIGLRDAAAETVEIRKGLVAGDTILLGAARGISPGTPVKVGVITDAAKR